MKKIILIGLLLITSNLYAKNYLTYRLLGDNHHYKCGYRKAVDELAIHPQKLLPAISQLNLSPDCLNHELKHFIENTKQHVRGFYYGLDADASIGAGVDGGMELIITAYDRQTIMVGLVKYGGGALSVGLPVGAGPTVGAIHGDCSTIDKYLGDFHNFSFLGFSKSFGANDEIKKFRLTKCNSSSNNDGLSMSLLGYSLTKYEAMSDFILLKGERAEELVDYINHYHPIN